MNFLNATGFDTSRKPSHVWDFNNDISICPLCKLIYSCVPAGFTYVYDRGIFINDNHNVQNLVDICTKIKIEVLKDGNMNTNTTFKSIINALNEKVNNSFKYELADIQVVRYEHEKYRFNILSKNGLKIIRDSKDDLNKLIKASYKEVDTYFRVYEELVKKLFNNENQFLLIHSTCAKN
jgi:CRISPR-associated protein Cst1